MAEEVVKIVMNVQIVLAEDSRESCWGFGSYKPCYKLYTPRYHFESIYINKTGVFDKDKKNISIAIKTMESQIIEYQNRGQLFKKLVEACKC
jgi:hypothetical protein